MANAVKNWKTTLGGILMSIGAPLAAAGEGIYKTVGMIMTAVGGLLLGISAADSKPGS